MCTPRDDFGVTDTLRAAYIVSCRCEHEACELTRVEHIVRWQSEPIDD